MCVFPQQSEEIPRWHHHRNEDSHLVKKTRKTGARRGRDESRREPAEPSDDHSHKSSDHDNPNGAPLTDTRSERSFIASGKRTFTFCVYYRTEEYRRRWAVNWRKKRNFALRLGRARPVPQSSLRQGSRAALRGSEGFIPLYRRLSDLIS